MIFTVFTVIFYALLFDRLNIFLYLLASSVLHEAGHISACLVSRKKPRLTVSVFGIKLSDYPEEKYKKLFVLLAGPMINLSMTILSYHRLKAGFSLYVYIFMCVNFAVFVFNMLPVYFLDGGQILKIFCNNAVIQKIFEITAWFFITGIIVFFADNIVISAVAATIFFIYYYINKKDLK